MAATPTTHRFRDEPRSEGVSFIEHLMPLHKFTHLLIVSGDRESEVRYLAGRVGNTEAFSQKTPEEKVAIVKAETTKARTLYVGDGINDAPARMSATLATLTLRTLREGRIRLALSRYRGVSCRVTIG